MNNYIRKKLLSLILFFIFILTPVSGCNSPKEFISSVTMQREQNSFDKFTKEIFIKEMQSNTINLHYTLSNPKEFGIKSHKISLGSLSKENAKASIAQLENLNAALLNFDCQQLTTSQQLTHDILSDYCEKELSVSSLYYYNEPLRPTTGIQSELPILLAEYAFYEPSDVTDYLALLTCIEDYFAEIAQFEQEKANLGLFMSDFSANRVIESCKTFTANPKENYLIETFNTRIDALDEISHEKKENYKKQNLSLVENSIIPAYENLIEILTKLKNSGSNDAGLCHFKDGISYYEYLVRSYTGSEKSIQKLQKATEEQRSKDMTDLHNLLVKHPNLLQKNNSEVTAKEPKEALNHLLEAMQVDFYPAANGNFEVNYIHKSLEGTLAPAFYLTAPIDDISHNVIYLNKSSNYSGLQLFTTLAHEGYPGHLYQTTGSYEAGLSPIRSLINYPGYVEGWATYVEMISYQYAGLDADTATMHMLNQSALLSLYATMDMGIHYDGWKLPQTTEFLHGYGITDSTVIQSIYELIVEEPAHYLKYYIGYLEFLELKEFAKKEFGEDYSNRAFHNAIIRIGPASFPILKEYLRDYYTPEK